MICNVHCFVENLIKWGQPVNVKKCYLPTRGRMQTWLPTHQLQEMNLKFVGHLPQDEKQLPIFYPNLSVLLYSSEFHQSKASPIVYSLENNKLNLTGLFVCHGKLYLQRDASHCHGIPRRMACLHGDHDDLLP